MTSVFLTGASSGIGAALAREFHRRGALVGLVARRQAALDEVAASCGERCVTYALAVRDRERLWAAAADFEARSGGADIVVANAGISRGVLTRFREDLAAFDDIVATNLNAAAATFHPFIESMRGRGRGTLVAVSSVAGVRGMPGSEAYCASKAALTVYAESLRVGLYGSGVRVVTLAPGFVRTPMTAANPYAMPFLMEPEAFARAAADAIARGRRYCVIPWQMGWVAAALHLMPDAVFDRVFAGRRRKPRAPAAQN